MQGRVRCVEDSSFKFQVSSFKFQVSSFKLQASSFNVIVNVKVIVNVNVYSFPFRSVLPSLLLRPLYSAAFYSPKGVLFSFFILHFSFFI